MGRRSLVLLLVLAVVLGIIALFGQAAQLGGKLTFHEIENHGAMFLVGAALFGVACGLAVRTSRERELHAAAARGDCGRIEELLRKGTSISASEGGLRSPLLNAACVGQVQACRTLLQRGARLELWEMFRQYDRTLGPQGEVFQNWVTARAFPVLMPGDGVGIGYAAQLGPPGAVKDPNAWTPLMLAVWSGQYFLVTLLLAAGAAINEQTAEGKTALTLSAEQGHEEIARLLLDQGADPSPAGPSGDDALAYAAWRGHVTTLEILLAADAPVQGVDNRPLMGAIHGGHAAAVRLLVEHGAPVNYTHRDGDTPLGLALKQGHPEIAAYLREKGGVA